MKFLLYLVTFFLLLNVFATAQSLIRDSCKKAAAKSPNVKLDFCVKSLEGNPQSKTAKTLVELVIASTKNAATKTTSLKAMVNKILKEKKYAKDSEMPLRDCLELYTDASASLNEALTSVKSRDYKTATVAMSAAMDAPSTCETGFKERKTPQKSPFAKENDVLSQTILIPLAFTNMLK
ncbi:hypothetical protein EUTSA_v10001100mg [Eutrema salsugineum]|uniref:Pectinesterase inhibitor domain-containing protein n=1 Tax=Eutrema salsugineum TaxID=72664 RepID=V4LBS2_EUTSA|nr:pectinesterase inhibitor 12 [Eutrema salsugineum]ESQ39842.1 hypothetical protein EUTSA_v10001100mg [Eutrema salsugineum]